MNFEAGIGLFGVVLVCLSQAIALPLVKIFDVPTGQMLIMRGLVSATVTWIILLIVGHDVWQGWNWLTVAAGGCFSVAALSLYKAIKAWDVSLVITLIAATPLVNVVMAVVNHKPVSVPALLTLPFLLYGIATACIRGSEDHDVVCTGSARRSAKRKRLRSKQYRKWGMFWCSLGVLFNGLYYEALAESQWTHIRSPILTERFIQLLPLAFWQAVAVALIGGFVSLTESWKGIRNGGPRTIVGLTCWAFFAGFVYFIGNILAFQGISRQVASVLLQLETPAVIVAGVILLPREKQERKSIRQWVGVIIALVSGAVLSLSL